MNAGRLTERVTIEAEVRTPDDAGGATLTWSAVATVWAAVEPLKGREQVEAMKLESSNLYRVAVRNHVAVTAANRLMWRGHVLNIREVPPTRPIELFRVLVAELGVAV